MARRRSEPKVFFPWERRRGVWGALGRARVQQILLLVLALGAFGFLRHREDHAAAVRATRATITTTDRAIDAFRADHAGGCPQSLSELVALGYARVIPLDAWGRPLRLTCPGRQDAAGYELSSDGPDGLPGGLDRVE